jgi:hypothetical protein
VIKFAYDAVDANGKNTFGIIEAENEEDAITLIGRQGLFPTDVRKANITETLRANIQTRVEEDRRQREQEQHRKSEEYRKKHPRQRLVVRYANGEVVYGICFAMNIRDPQFHLDIVDVRGAATGERRTVRFTDLKAVFQVRSFDGKTDRLEGHFGSEASGPEVVVMFKDGEKLRGHLTHAYNPREERFQVVPHDPRSNNLITLCEGSAVDRVLTVEEYQSLRASAVQAEKKQAAEGVLSQEETLGDFYFTSRNYEMAFQQYKLAGEKSPGSIRLRKKMLAAEYNIGVGFIKRRQYDKALDYMQSILRQEPNNDHAKRKVAQLQKIKEKSQAAPQSGHDLELH